MAYIFAAGAVEGVWTGARSDYTCLEGAFHQHLMPPHRIEWHEPTYPLPDVLNMPMLCISERCRTTIEKLEPGVHRFLPVDMSWRDDDRTEQRYLLDVRNVFDALSEQHSTRDRWGRWVYWPGKLDHRLVIHKLRVGDRHLWHNRGLQHGTEYVVSNALAKAMQADELTGVYLSPLNETDEAGRYAPPARSRDRVYELHYDDLRGTAWVEKALDGNVEAVEPAVLGPLRPVLSYRFRRGVPIRTEHLPTRVRYGAARKTPSDLSWATDFFTVSRRLRDMIEEFEPGIHQFASVDYLTKQGELIEQRYILNICRIVDGGSVEHSTIARTQELIGGLWRNPGKERGDVKYDQAKVDGAHLWLDPALPQVPTIMISAPLAEAIAAAKFSGILFRPYDLVQAAP